MRRYAVVFVLLASLVLAVAGPATAAPYCGIRWGSLSKTSATYTGVRLADVDAGRHTCYDRLVFHFGGQPPTGYDVRYVENVYTDGQGALVPLGGGAKLRIILHGSAHDERGRPTYAVPADGRLFGSGAFSGWRTFRDVRWAGDFEGQVTVGLGVRARLPFRVFTLKGPGSGSRVVVDVAHRW